MQLVTVIHVFWKESHGGFEKNTVQHDCKMLNRRHHAPSEGGGKAEVGDGSGKKPEWCLTEDNKGRRF